LYQVSGTFSIGGPGKAQLVFEPRVLKPHDGDAQVIFDPTLSAFHLLSDDPIEHSHFTADFGPIDFVEYEYSRVGNLDVGLSISETGLTQFGFALSWSTFNPATLLGGLLVAPVSDGPAPHPDPQTGVEGRYIVTIFIDQAGTPGGNALWAIPFGQSGVGHVFLQGRDTETGECVTAGFGPVGMPAGFAPCPGVITDNRHCNWDVRKSWVVDEETFRLLRARISLDRRFPPQYDLNHFNCAVWARNTLAICDIELNVTSPYYDRTGLVVFMSAPGPLGRDVIRDGGELRKR